MSNHVSAVADNAVLDVPTNTIPLLSRLAELTQLRYFTPRTQVEAAAITRLLRADPITGLDVWKLLLDQYNISTSASSSPHPDDEPNWLTPVLADQAAIWANLTALAEGRIPAPLLQVRAPYGEPDEADEELATRWLASLAQQLGYLGERYFVGARALLSALPFSVSHDIRHELAVEWLGGAHAVGASMEALPLNGGGAFGIDGQGVYALKAIALALKHELSELSRYEAESPDNTVAVEETRARIEFWWSLLKGFVYSMLQTKTGTNIPAMLLQHPDAVSLIKAGLKAGLIVLLEQKPQQPKWGGRRDCVLDSDVGNTPTSDLLDQLVERLASEQKDADARASFYRHGI